MNTITIETKNSQSWNDSLLLGIPLVDKQHKILISLFDEIISVSKEDDSEDKILPLLNELQRYTIYHFNTEEELMRQKNLQNTELHLKQHNLFKKKIDDFIIAHNYKNIVLLNQIILFLRKWLVTHISDIDSSTLKHQAVIDIE